jgi:hypothetical protein
MSRRYFQQTIGGEEIEVDKTGKPVVEGSSCTAQKGA